MAWVSTYLLLRYYAPEAHPVFIVSLFAFIFYLVIAGFIDWEWKIIPDKISFGLMIMGIISCPFNFLLPGNYAGQKVIQSLVGPLAGGGLLFLISFLGEKFFKKEVMGFGDIKLLAGMGSILGWQGVLVTGIISSIAGGVFAILGLLFGFLKRRQYLPFGPFLVVGGIVSLFMLIVLAQNSFIWDVKGIN